MFAWSAEEWTLTRVLQPLTARATALPGRPYSQKASFFIQFNLGRPSG
jgi:hypothetical protein